MPVSFLLLLIGEVAKQEHAQLGDFHARRCVFELDVCELVHEIDTPASEGVSWVQDNRVCRS